MLADAAGRAWRAAKLEVPEDRLVWSPDGARLAWLDSLSLRGPDDIGSLHILDVASGRLASYPCPCRGVGYLAEDVATLSADGTALLLFPPSGQPRRVVLDRRQPDYSQVAAGGRDRIAVAVPLDERKVGVRGQSTLVTVDRSGRIARLFRTGEMASFIQGLASPDGRQFVWMDLASGGACRNTASLPLRSYQGGRPVGSAPPTDAAFREALLKDQRMILSYAWAGPGVTVTFAPEACQALYPFRLVSYYREGSSWTLLGTGWLGIAFGRDGRIAKLEASDPVARRTDDSRQEPLGRLVLADPSGAEKTIADNVSFFAFTPPEAASAHPPAAPPSQAGGSDRTALVTTDEKGAPLSGPLYELAKQIMASAATGDVDGLVKLCADCDEDTIAWLRSPGGSDQLLRSMQTYPSAQRQSLVFPSLARRPCVDDAGKDLMCTAAQIKDVVRLGLKSKPSLEHGDREYTASRDISVYLRLDATGTAGWLGHLRYDQSVVTESANAREETVDVHPAALDAAQRSPAVGQESLAGVSCPPPLHRRTGETLLCRLVAKDPSQAEAAYVAVKVIDAARGKLETDLLIGEIPCATLPAWESSLVRQAGLQCA